MKTPPISQPDAPVPPNALAVRVSKLSGYVLAGLLAIGLVSCGWLFYSGKITFLPPNLSRDDVMHGEVTHKIAKQLSNAWLPEQAANLERGASWVLFHDTGPRVRSGCPGWLFLNEELQVNRHASHNADVKAGVVVELQKKLAARGIELLVAVVPDKSRIASSALCHLERPASLDNRVTQWAETLREAGVTVINLEPMLAPLATSAYLRTDTHWNETGAKAAANAIAKQIQAMGVQAKPSATFEVSTQAPAIRPGDLVRLAGIDWLPLRLQPTPESVVTTDIKEQQSTDSQGGDDLADLLGDDQLPNVALIGTSFSRNANFVGFLQLALGAKIGSFAKDGGKFSGSANDYFSNAAFEQTPPKLVIWEIPERDLQTPYDVIDLVK
jgi:alginate O-acetyltransferase complex protein AlgJ